MKIIRVIESFYPYMSGPANQAFNISSRLPRSFSTRLLTSRFKANKAKKKELISDIDVHRFPISLKFMKYFYTPCMKKEFKDFDLVHAHSFRSYQTEIGYTMARKRGKPFVISNHGSVLGYTSFVKGFRTIPYKLYDLFNKRIVIDADAVIVNTKQEYAEVVRYGVNEKKIQIIPVGIDSKNYTPRKRTWKETRLLFVGRITRDRNLVPIIKAVKNLEGENVRLRIVGSAEKRTDTEKAGYLESLQTLVHELGIEKKVEFVGPKYGAELREFYRTSDIFVYTSRWENFGQTILEAAAAGLPLICTRVGVALDLIDNKTGRLVEDDYRAVSSAIEHFMDARRRKIAKEILLMKIKTGYNWADIVKTYVRLYNSLEK